MNRSSCKSQPCHVVGAARVLMLLAGLLTAGGAQAGETLPAASPESQGMRSEVLRRMSELVRREKHDIRSMIVLRHGTVVLDWYAGGVTRDHNHNLYSVTKSVVATLTGIAVDTGHLPGADTPLDVLFQDSDALAGDAVKRSITIADLLTMRSGLPSSRANRPTGPEKELFDRIHREPDRGRYILGLEMAGVPGEAFLYGNAEPQLVVSILERSARERALPFANRTLFGPLGFKNVQWIYPDASGTVAGGYGLRLRAIDMAKLGQLHLQGGAWGDKRVVSADWVKAATSDLTGTGYGYYWWTGIEVGPYASYAAKGVRGQTIQVVPELDLVFVVTANLPPDEVKPVLSKLAGEFVVRAVESETPLPESPREWGLLREELAQAQRYVPAARNGLIAAMLPYLPDDTATTEVTNPSGK